MKPDIWTDSIQKVFQIQIINLRHKKFLDCTVPHQGFSKPIFPALTVLVYAVYNYTAHK